MKRLLKMHIKHIILIATVITLLVSLSVFSASTVTETTAGERKLNSISKGDSFTSLGKGTSQGNVLHCVDWQSSSSFALIGSSYSPDNCGHIVKYDGSSFTDRSKSGYYDFYGMSWRTGGSYALVVGTKNSGDYGVIFKDDGTTTTTITESLSGIVFYDVDWDNTGTGAIIVGEYLSTHTSCAYQYIHSSGALNDLSSQIDAGSLHDIAWRNDGSYALVLADNNYVYKYDYSNGFSYIGYPSGSGYLYGVTWKSDDSYALIVGSSGKMYKYSGGSSFPSISTGTTYDLNGVSCKPGGNDALIVGWNGVVLKYDGSSVSSISSGISQALRDVAWKPNGDYALVVGGSSSGNGCVYKFQPNRAPYTPLSAPSGSTSGVTLHTYSYSISTTDPDGDSIQYGWDWNGDSTVDDWSGYYSSGSTCTMSHSWSSAGTYNVQVKAMDGSGAGSSFSPSLSVSIITNSVNNPSQPSGPSGGNAGTSLGPYSTSATDPNGDQVKYGWDWDGDNIVDDWSSLGASGWTEERYHSWSADGTYNVYVKAEDAYGTQSGWSNALTVTILSNNPPTSPTYPYCEGVTNPQHVTDFTPEFNAIFQDPDTGDKGTYAQIYVGTAVDSNNVWDSGWIGITDVAIGSRCQDISYTGSYTLSRGVTYYWKIRFKDLNGGAVGDWSGGQNFRINQLPNPPTLTAPANNVWTNDNTPYFDWSFSDPDTDDTAQGGFNVQIDNDYNFGSIDYERTAASSNTYWQFPEGTGYTTIPDGTWYWRVRTKDNHDDNWGDYCSYWTVKIDTVAPTTDDPDIGDPKYGSFPVYVKSTTTFTLTATDDGSDAVTIYYKIDSGSWNTYTTAFTVTDAGPHTIHYNSTDAVGNKESMHSLSVYVDDETPTVTPGSTVYPEGQSAAKTGDTVTLQATVTDSGSGIASVEADASSINPSEGWITMSNVEGTWQCYVTVSSGIGDGTRSLQVKAVDNLGNTNQAQYLAVEIDNTPSASTVNAVTPYWQTSTPFTITATASDTVSVKLYYKYSIDNSSWGGWTLFGEDTVSPWNWSFTAPNGDGYYQFYSTAKDSAGNWETKTFCDALCGVDTNAPDSSVNTISPYWQTSTPVTVSASASDTMSGVKNVSLWYRYSSDNISWSSWTSFGADTSSPWSWSFNAPSGDGYYEFYSIASDVAGLVEAAPVSADSICGVDTSVPSSSVDSVSPYWQNITSFTITATTSDATVKNVTLWYRYSVDNSSWGVWTNFGTDTASPWSWSFSAPSGDGYYEFYSIAVDNAGWVESAPAGGDALCGVDTGSPTSFVGTVSPYWQNIVPFTVTASASDTLSGVKNVALYYRYSSNNASWGDWTLFSTNDTLAPYEWLFTAPEGDGYYEFYSIATDTANNKEETPSVADAVVGVDVTPPYVLSTNPYNKKINVPITQNIVVTFDDEMNKTATQAAFSISPNPGGWGWSWSTDSKTLTGVHNPFSLNTNYTCTIGTSAMDKAGNTLTTGYSWWFITVTGVSASIVSPNGGEVYKAGSTISINYTISGGTPGYMVKLFYTDTGKSTYTFIGYDNRTDEGGFEYLWPTPSTLDSACMKIKINVTDSAELFTSCEDESDNCFTIDSSKPMSSVDPVSPYWRNQTFTITAVATDATSSVMQVEVFYRYSADNLTGWTDWTPMGADTSSPWSWEFTVPMGDGYYRFYSKATDMAGNVEEDTPPEYDAICGVDTTQPLSSVDPIIVYWRTDTVFTITATSSDSLSDVCSVKLFYRYSSDNTTWDDWVLFDTDTISPWSWSFDSPEGDGYYEFYSTATDNAGNVEDAPGIADTICGVDTNPPSTNIVVGSPNCTIEDIAHVTSATTFTLETIDTCSGVQFTWYTINTVYYVYMGTMFTLSGYGDGYYTITYGGRDCAGNNETDKSITVYLDNTPPEITVVQNSSVTCSSATITWSTDEPSDSLVEYGTSLSYGLQKYNATMCSSHAILLSDLTPLTMYYFRVTSVDCLGNTATSTGYSFTTLTDNIPPGKPSKPVGTTTCYTNTSYPAYTTYAADPDGNSLMYEFYWDDGTTSTTTYYASGSTASITHTWTTSGTRSVKCRAYDGMDYSEWSDTLTVNVIATPTVTVNQPNGGETIYANNEYTITWATSGGMGTLTIKIEYSTTGVNGAYTLIENYLSDTGSYTWTVPNKVSVNSYIKITVTDQNSKTAYDTSNNAFTISSNPPDKPANPSPEDEEKDVAVGVALSWSCSDPDSGDTLTFDVYFGTTPTPSKYTTTSYTTCSPTLEYSTHYHWQIIVRDQHGGTISGDVWEFWTEAAPNQQPTVTLSSPDSDSTVSDTVTISGSASDPDGNLQAVYVKIDSGSWRLATGTTSWSYSWDTTQTTNNCWHIISARSYDGSLYSDTVSINVYVSNPVSPEVNHVPGCSITSPTSGQTLSGTVTVTGTAWDDDGDSIMYVDVWIDSNAWSPATGTNTWRYKLDTTQYSDGTHTIYAFSYDGTATSPTTSVSINIQNAETGTAPKIYVYAESTKDKIIAQYIYDNLPSTWEKTTDVNKATTVITVGGPGANTITGILNDKITMPSWGWKQNEMRIKYYSNTNDGYEDYCGIVGTVTKEKTSSASLGLGDFTGKNFVVIFGTDVSGTVMAARVFMDEPTYYLERGMVTYCESKGVDYELKHVSSPNPDTPINWMMGYELGDTDIDGLSNSMELGGYVTTTDPYNWDTDNDGMGDEWEREHDLNPIDKSDADADPDNDGIPNICEYLYNGDPNIPDTPDDDTVDFSQPTETSGTMWKMLIGVGGSGGWFAGGGMDVYFDFYDIMGWTEEGKDWNVTVWVVGQVGVSIVGASDFHLEAHVGVMRVKVQSIDENPNLTGTDITAGGGSGIYGGVSAATDLSSFEGFIGIGGGVDITLTYKVQKFCDTVPIWYCPPVYAIAVLMRAGLTVTSQLLVMAQQIMQKYIDYTS